MGVVGRVRDDVQNNSRFSYPQVPGWTVFAYETVTSTNDLAKEYAKQHEMPFCVIADHQTMGRGTKGRSFFSPKDKGLYMSLCLRRGTKSLLSVTPQAAVAVLSAIETVTGQPGQIKWVNDILMKGKKVCGILTESVMAGGESVVVIGIGINLVPADLPVEIRETAGAIGPNANPPAREVLMVEILRNIDRFVREGDASYLPVYVEKSAVIGHEILVSQPSGWKEAKAIGIDGQGRLLVTMDHETRALFTEEIRLLNREKENQ